MKTSQFKDYSELPLFLNAEIIAKVLGISPASSYELMHEADFPVLKIGCRFSDELRKKAVWGFGCEKTVKSRNLTEYLGFQVVFFAES